MVRTLDCICVPEGVLDANGSGKQGVFAWYEQPLSTELRWGAYFPRNMRDYGVRIKGDMGPPGRQGGAERLLVSYYTNIYI